MIFGRGNRIYNTSLHILPVIPHGLRENEFRPMKVKFILNYSLITHIEAVIIKSFMPT